MNLPGITLTNISDELFIAKRSSHLCKTGDVLDTHSLYVIYCSFILPYFASLSVVWALSMSWMY